MRILQTQFNKASMLDRISGAEFDNTNTVFKRTEKGLSTYSNGSNAKITIGNKGNLKSVHLILKLKTTTEQIFEGDPIAHLIHANAGTLTYPDWDNAFVDSDDTNTIDTNWHSVVITSTTNVNCTDIELALNNTSYGNLYIALAEGYDHELSQDEIDNLYEDFLKLTNLSETKRGFDHRANVADDLRNYPDVVAGFNMKKSPGEVLTDISLNTNNGTITKALQTYEGIDFNGADSIINCGADASIANIWDGGGKIQFLINPRSDGETNTGRIIEKRAGWGLNVQNESSGYVKLRILADFSGDNGVWVTDNAIIKLDEESLIEITYDSDNVANNPVLTVNGVNYTVGSGLTESTTPTGTRSTDASRDLIMGNTISGSLTFDGIISEVYLYNTSTPSREAITWNDVAKKVYIEDNLEYDKADGTNITPEGWIAGTATVKIGEIAEGEQDLTVGMDKFSKYMEWTGNGTIKYPYNKTTNVDASFKYYDGASWVVKSDTLANLITDNAFLSLSGGYLVWTLTTGERIAKRLILNGVQV